MVLLTCLEKIEYYCAGQGGSCETDTPCWGRRVGMSTKKHEVDSSPHHNTQDPARSQREVKLHQHPQEYVDSL